MSSGVVATTCANGSLLELVIDVPKGNVLARSVMESLDAALSARADDPHLKAVVIRGAGKHFSFGAAIEEHRRDLAPAMLEAFHTLIRRVGMFPVPVIAAVEGRCLGGAFELALACHMVIATPSAIFACPEIKLGVIPPVLAAIGPARLGAATAERMLLTGGELDARAARALGFVAEIVPEEAVLAEWMRAWHESKLLPLSAYALRQGVAASRRALAPLFTRAIAEAEQQYLAGILPSHDGNEGVEAFLAKRPPAWRDA